MILSATREHYVRRSRKTGVMRFDFSVILAKAGIQKCKHRNHGIRGIGKSQMNSLSRENNNQLCGIEILFEYEQSNMLTISEKGYYKMINAHGVLQPSIFLMLSI